MGKIFFILTVLFFTLRIFAQYDEPHRPQLHFSPPAHWTNDPNGMVYVNGEYHLFYQYYPNAAVWGPMHWGHTVSRDLIHWENLPIALTPDKLGYIFSGSAVLDKQNSSGFGTKNNPPMVAMFTYHNPDLEKAGRQDFQYQGIAYSTDGGRIWTKYDQNPVIPNTDKIRDFRDTKVFWDETSKKWVVVFAAGNHVLFYSSPNLKDWQMTGEFGKSYGSHKGVWECPDLFPLKVAGTNQTKWVLIVNINPGAPNGGSGTQYFIGDFDGETFKSNGPPEEILWLDYGRDNYAGVTWSNAPNNRRIFIGWMSNWDYAETVPTEKWRNAMTLPRDLSLVKTEKGLRLAQNPVAETINLRDKKLLEKKNFIVQNNFDFGEIKSPLNEITIEIDLSKTFAKDFGLELSNSTGENYKIGFDRAQNVFYSDRLNSGKHDFSGKFAVKRHFAPRFSNQKTLKMHLFFDTASAELFADNGQTVVTDIFFPTTDFTKFRFFTNGKTTVNQAQTWSLKSIWR